MRRRTLLLLVMCTAVAADAAACRSPEQRSPRTSEGSAPAAGPRAAPSAAAPARSAPRASSGAGAGGARGAAAPASRGVVTCEATLAAVDPRFRWFDNHGGSHDDGVALLATFRVTAPKAYAGRKVGILFKYAKRLTPPTPAQVGQRFTFEVPAGYFVGKAWIMDNLTARALAPRPR